MEFYEALDQIEDIIERMISKYDGDTFDEFKEEVIKRLNEINNMSTVEIRLFNHKTNKALYENLTTEQLEHILKIVDPKGWS